MSASTTARGVPRSVIIWLAGVYAMVVLMVLLGGITRLTGSGLSMVDWRPLMGTLPPLDAAGWQRVFERYQGSPQYRLVNDWMTLGDFKRIFFWEYTHRLVGRLTGLVFVLPWLVLVVRKRMPRALALKSAVAFVLGGLQGLLGWVMVKSGLADVPAVSHYRLAAHLALALLVACWLLWLLFGLLVTPAAAARVPAGDPALLRRLRIAALALLALVVVQVVYGGLMAGARAGYLYQSFPLMNGSLLPSQAFGYQPAWRNLLDNPFGIHVIHRSLGWLVGLSAIALWWGMHTLPRGALARRAGGWLLALVAVQITLGALTVLLRVPVAVATLHQLGGVAVLSLALLVLYALAVGARAATHRPGVGTAAEADMAA